jgi:TRAP-type C4-dicarboxylate transport system permease large subunit
VILKISDGISKVAMLTIPFFVLAGAIMAEGRLIAFADVLVGFTRLRGGLSIVNVLATTFMSGIPGSAVADTSAIAVAAAACAALNGARSSGAPTVPNSSAVSHALRLQTARALTDWTGAGDCVGCTVVDGSIARMNSA